MSYDVIVIGGGQAGLAAGHLLARQGRRFTILEATGAPAAAWRDRWDSLRLFAPARYDGLPGMPFPGEPDRYPTRDEVAGYLARYAEHLPVEYGARVTGLRPAATGSSTAAGSSKRTRSSSPRGRSSSRGRPRSPARWTRASSSCTAASTATRRRYRTAPC